MLNLVGTDKRRKVMGKAYKWEKQQIGNKWYTVCVSHEHMPMIEHCKNGYYKVTGSDGKARLEKEFVDAKKFAIQTFNKMKKFNKDWDKENA